MAVQNSLTRANDFNNKMVEFDCNGQSVKLSPAIIRNYLVSGGGNVTDQEIVMFLNLCRFQRLNPFLREAYLIKFGSSPATIVTGKEVFTKRAYRTKAYAGQQAGVIVQKENGEIESRIGTLLLKDEILVGGWAKIYIKGYEIPIEITVNFEEYVGRKKDGEINSQWEKKPATMIRKVALVQGLREAFPEEFQGMYSQEEVNVDESFMSEVPIDIEQPDISKPEIIEPPKTNKTNKKDAQDAFFE